MKRKQSPTYKDVIFVMNCMKHGFPPAVYLVFWGLTIPCGIADLIMIAVLLSNAFDNWGLENEVKISLTVMIIIFVLFISFAVWLLIRNLKQYRKIDKWLCDSIEVRASVRAKGSQYYESTNMANHLFEITLHLSDGDIVKTSSTEKSVSSHNAFLYRYSGKETTVFYSKMYDMIMFANDKYINNGRAK